MRSNPCHNDEYVMELNLKFNAIFYSYNKNYLSYCNHLVLKRNLTMSSSLFLVKHYTCMISFCVYEVKKNYKL